MFFTINRNPNPASFRRRAAAHALTLVAGIIVGQMLSGIDYGALSQRLPASDTGAAATATLSESEAMASAHVRSPDAVLEIQPVVKPINVTILDIDREIRGAL